MTRREAYLQARAMLAESERAIVLYDHATGPRVILMTRPMNRIEIALPADVDRFAVLDRIEHGERPWSMADYQKRLEKAIKKERRREAQAS